MVTEKVPPRLDHDLAILLSPSQANLDAFLSTNACEYVCIFQEYVSQASQG